MNPLKTLPLPRSRLLNFTQGPLVMGIINCTSDSFYAPSRYQGESAAADRAGKMVADGAHILDIGGESSRPGSDYVSVDEELDRVIPVIQAVRSRWDIPISIDTRKARVALQALEAGADMVNDISALQDNPGLAQVVKDKDVVVILMHMRGTPRDMQKNPSYLDTLAEIKGELEEAVQRACDAGIQRNRIIIDPGIGFGKRVMDNLLIIRQLHTFKSLGLPILMGLSRKSFLGKVLQDKEGHDRAVEERLAGTITANVLSILHGANIIRVHDVKEASDMVRVLRAISEQGNS